MRRRFTADVYVPFSNQIFVVTVDVSGVPEGTSGLVNGIQNLRRTNGRVSQPAQRWCIAVDYLQTFLIRASGTIGNRQTHTTIPDGVEGLTAKSSGLGRHFH